MSALTFREFVQVGRRFSRSVNLERDFYIGDSLDGYILTAVARSTLRRLVEATSNGATSRAWTLTGPYGSGKSAFALFAARALSGDASEGAQQARAIAKAEDRYLWKDFFGYRSKGPSRGRGFCPILISGAREPIGTALLRGLERGLKDFWAGRGTLRLQGEVSELCRRAEKGKIPPASKIADLFEQASEKVHSSRNPGRGLLIIIDELGKLLEYAAQYPNRSDLFVLQTLAELAARSGNRPILLVTILHQAFARYVKRLTAIDRDEWAKIQGRFEDIAFQESTEQLLRLVAKAVQHHSEDDTSKSLEQYGRNLAQEAFELGIAPRGIPLDEFLTLIGRCMPLHPLVAIILGPLFRRLAQNERSVFAFLTSREPYGFQEFLRNHVWDEGKPKTFMLDILYDYVVSAVGTGLYIQGNGKRWARIESVLDRLSNPSELEVRLIKTIGLLGAIGEIGNLKASKELLRFALLDGHGYSTKVVDKALNSLKSNSVIAYRRYNHAYRLWEGSDVDLDARVKEARLHIDSNERLVKQLTNYLSPKPLVARRHSLQTGTLRYFEVRYADLEGFESAIGTPLGEADGAVIYGLPANETEAKGLTKKCRELRMRPEIIVAIPRHLGQLRTALQGLVCLRWVRRHTPELEGDATARRELRARLAEVERRLEEELQGLFDLSQGLRQQQKPIWYHKGARISISSQRQLVEYLSTICDEVYPSTPRLRNELINRRHLSSSAAAARRKLIEAMLTRSGQPHLGIDGFPPEISMYFSLLSEHGLHRQENSRWGFYPPREGGDQGMVETWKAIERFFAETEIERRSVTELFDSLQKPPYGLKSGLLPVLLCAALLYYDTEIALYEQGSFVPDLTIAVFERMMKSPWKFEVQRCRIAGVRAAVFERFARTLGQASPKDSGGKPNLLGVVKPLVRFASQLPKYTRVTRHLSETTRRVRDVLYMAREPDRLLFTQLPEACGFQPFLPDRDHERKDIDDFFKSLREALSELQRAYDDLLTEIEHLLIQAFTLRGGREQARQELRKRSLPLLDLVIDAKLKSFLIRMTDETPDLLSWVESIGTFLANKPPASWNDQDRARSEMTLAQLAHSYRHFEILAFELGKQNGFLSQPGVEALRVGITTPNMPEQERVVILRPEERRIIAQAEEKLAKALQAAGLKEDVELSLAAIGRLSRKLLSQLEKGTKSWVESHAQQGRDK